MSKGNRFFTILIIPEKTSQVRRLVIPAWLARGAVIGSVFAGILGGMMVLDYWFVMNQISENKELKLENRRLKQQVQVFKNKMTSIESTMERVKTFAARLRVITNLEDRGNLVQRLNEKLPDATTNISQVTPLDLPEAMRPPASGASQAIAATTTTAEYEAGSPESEILRKEYEELDSRFSQINYETLYVEQILQDQYELLADQKAFLAALPTRKPAIGYFTSGFGIRRSPFGGREKMHEGLDIANQPGTPIRATADGVVVYADTKPGYGQTVIVDHGYGLETWYGHCRKLLVSKGQKVRRGDPIAHLGNSGRSTGPHLHYEVRVHGTPVDPLSYILEN